MARKKRASDELYNQRRRAKRAIARIEANPNATRRDRAYASALKIGVSQSYVGRNASPERLRASLAAGRLLSMRTAGAKAGAAERRDIMFRAQIGASSRKGANIAGMTRARSKIFFRATQRYWAGKGPDKLASIQAAFGGAPLDEIYRMVMSQQTEALRREYAERKARTGGLTIDPDNALQQALAENVDRDQGSPDYMVYVAEVAPVAL